uniref:Uncharacterized protein n=1 Tax=Nelumbo nucifera TaxID=4432 RepID=A0A822ZJ76_NELNU|nr:TPA_asm: hypothetical protein HUJ06_001911 [Nelumbo nucifera]
MHDSLELSGTKCCLEELNSISSLGSLKDKLRLEGREAHGLGASVLSPAVLEIESCSILLRH